MLLILLQSNFPSIEVSQVVNEIFQGGGFAKVTDGIKGLAYVAIVFFFGTLVAKMFSGKETVNPSSFAPVIMYALLVTNWAWFNGEIDRGFKAIQTSFEAATPTDSRSNEKYKEILAKWQEIPTSGTGNPSDIQVPVEEPDGMFADLKAIKEGIENVVNIINNPEIFILKMVMFMTYLFNQCIIMMFNAFAAVWINLLRIGGIVAATLYFFPKMSGAFTNWIKTYASVYLWVPLGAIMIYVSDQIFLKVIDSVPIPNVLENIQMGLVVEADAMAKMGLVVVTAIATTVLKLILLSKVPNIISYWLNGGSTGDMFGSTSAFVMSGATAAMGTAKIGAEAATGGVSGGQLAGSGMGDIGGSLKGDN